MTQLKKLVTWLRSLVCPQAEEPKQDDLYESGYGWAWAAYMVEKLDVSLINAYIQGKPEDPFMQGAAHAMADMLRISERFPLRP